MTLTTPLPTAWAHLPNAAHIDRILSSLETNPEKWAAAWSGYARSLSAAWDAARYAIRGTARDIVWEEAHGCTWEAAIRGAAGNKALDEASSAILALIAWDDCAHMLDLAEATLSELRAAGTHPAILLSTAASVLKETL